jgi:dTDP-4-amino-4,6-dideoxygalactose transaminase
VVAKRTPLDGDRGAAMTIPVMKPWFGPEEEAAAAEAVRSGWVAQGPRVREFEEAVAERLGAAHAVAVSSCTTALHLALVLLRLGPGDEVIVPSLSFIATANVVVHAGARPVFADVSPSTLCVTPASVSPLLTARTRAVIVVHQAGTPADIDALHELCDPRGVAIIEDAACAIGSVYKGRPVGGVADAAALSFHPRKIITTGEGGMLLLADGHAAERARRLREHGMSVSAEARHNSRGVILEAYSEVGFNYRMTDVQASIGLVQVGRLDAIIARRRELAETYRRLLDDIPGISMISDPPYGLSNFQSFWVELPDGFPATRDELLSALAEAGVSARRGIMAAHLEPAYRGQGGALPVTERATHRSLILPMFHEMGIEDQYHVANVVRKEAGLPAAL